MTLIVITNTNEQADVFCISNYREINVSNSSVKLLDRIITTECIGKFGYVWLSFWLKSTFSHDVSFTNEIINYYFNNKTMLYILYQDASESFMPLWIMYFTFKRNVTLLIFKRRGIINDFVYSLYKWFI